MSSFVILHHVNTWIDLLKYKNWREIIFLETKALGKNEASFFLGKKSGSPKHATPFLLPFANGGEMGHGRGKKTKYKFPAGKEVGLGKVR